MLRIIADDNIPFVREAFSGLGDVLAVPGRELTPALVRDADVLLVRSTTTVAAELVRGSRIRFVGSASIGADHVDTGALAAAGIPFHNAPGSNADSVVEYVLAALLALAAERGEVLRGRTLGVIGCGNIGSRLARRAGAFGMHVLRNDPPLAAAADAAGRPHEYVPLERVLAESDVVSIHVPLVRSGRWPTHHLLGAAELERMRPGSWLLNTSRGAVISGDALATALLEERGPAAVVLDVWEHEPQPSLDLLRLVDIGTPHIAGHSFDGKVNGTIMLHDALVRELGLVSGWSADDVLAMSAEDCAELLPPEEDPADEVLWLDALARQMYDVAQDDLRMRTLLLVSEGERPTAFQQLRRSYPRRRAFSRHVLPDRDVPAPLRAAVRNGLGVGA